MSVLFAVPKEPLLSAQLCFDDEEEEKEVKKEPSRHAHSSPLRGPSLNLPGLNSPNSFLGTDVMSSSPKAKSPHPASYEGEQGMYRHQHIRADFDVHSFFFSIRLLTFLSIPIILIQFLRTAVSTKLIILYLNSYLLTLEAISRACSGHPKGRLSFGSLSLWKILAMIIAEGLLNVASKIKNRPWFV